MAPIATRDARNDTMPIIPGRAWGTYVRRSEFVRLTIMAVAGSILASGVAVVAYRQPLAWSVTSFSVAVGIGGVLAGLAIHHGMTHSKNTSLGYSQRLRAVESTVATFRWLRVIVTAVMTSVFAGTVAHTGYGQPITVWLVFLSLLVGVGGAAVGAPWRRPERG